MFILRLGLCCLITSSAAFIVCLALGMFAELGSSKYAGAVRYLAQFFLIYFLVYSSVKYDAE